MEILKKIILQFKLRRLRIKNGYILALISVRNTLNNYRNEQDTDWTKFLCRDVAGHYKRALKYIEHNLEDIKFKP